MTHDTLPMPRGFIFDYGGTIDTNGCHWGKMIWHAYERLKVPVDEKCFREAYVYAERTLGRTPIIQSTYNFHATLKAKLRIQMDYLLQNALQGSVGETEAEKMTDDLLDDLYTRVRQTVADNRWALECLAEKVPLALVSNFYGNIGVVLKEMEIDGLFKAVVESAVVGVRKPDPRIFLMGAEALGLQAGELVAVGDNYSKDIVPASNSGFRTVWLRGEQWDEQEYDTSLPECVVDTIGALPALFGLAPK